MEEIARSSFVFEAEDRACLGKPRVLALKNYDRPFVRIVPTISQDEHNARRGTDDRRDRHAVARLIERLGEIKMLAGPATSDEVDTLAAKVFAEAPNFAPAIEAILERLAAQ